MTKLNLQTNLNKVFFTLFLSTILFLSYTDSFSQTTVDIIYAEDNTLYEDLNGETSNGVGSYFFTGTTAGGEIRRGVLKFFLNKNIPPCAIVTDVSLTLYMSKTISGDKNVELRKLERNWGSAGSDAPGEEGFGTQAEMFDATWLHTFYDTEFWSQAGGDFSTDPSAVEPVGGVGFYTWDSSAMIQDVQSWVDDPGANYGWLLLGEERDPGTAKRFNSIENDSLNLRPVLTVTYTTNFFSFYTTTVIEGFWNGTSMVDDTVKVTLRNSTSPYAPVYSSTSYTNGFEGSNHCFAPVSTGSYYIAVNHRNSIETWSKLPFSFIEGNSEYYDFSISADQAYGDNQVLKLGKYCIYSGDVDQDGVIDVTDAGIVDNDSFNFNSGYIPSDTNGDMITDLADATIVDNNSFNFVTKITP